VAYRNSGDTKKYLEDAYSRFGLMIKKLNIQKEPKRNNENPGPTSSFLAACLFFCLFESLRLGIGTPKNPGMGFLTFGASGILGILSMILLPSNFHSKRGNEGSAPSCREVMEKNPFCFSSSHCLFQGDADLGVSHQYLSSHDPSFLDFGAEEDCVGSGFIRPDDASHLFCLLKMAQLSISEWSVWTLRKKIGDF
jgi:hypothetical protein